MKGQTRETTEIYIPVEGNLERTKEPRRELERERERGGETTNDDICVGSSSSSSCRSGN